MDTCLAPLPRTSARIIDFPNLDESRERELFARMRSADSADDRRVAVTELWMSHGKLVAAIAAKYRRSGIDHNDLINAGHLGLHAAIMRFDASRFNTRLSAYASIWIRSYVQDYIRRNVGPVRLSDSKAHRQLVQCAPRLIADARKSCERECVAPTDTELHLRIGRRVGLTEDQVAQGLRLIQGAKVSLNNRDENGEYGSNLPDGTASTSDDINERMDQERLRSRIHTLANDVLGERERIVFLARSMSDGHAVPSQDVFAGQFGVSNSRVHQIEVSARRKIAVALVVAGYTECAVEAVVADLSQVRARRRAETNAGGFHSEVAYK
jgi:RNA polymerase sigma-32 factor